MEGNKSNHLIDLDNSGTDTQTINAVLVGTDLQLSMENTTATRTVDLSSIDTDTDEQDIDGLPLTHQFITVGITGEPVKQLIYPI